MGRGICENCGYYRSRLDESNCFCPVCNTEFTKLGMIDGYKVNNLNGEQRAQWAEKKFGHPISEEMHNLRREYQKRAWLEYEKQEEEEQRRLEEERKTYEWRAMQNAYNSISNPSSARSNVPKCPVCGSTSLKKISLTTRAVKTAVFGTIGAIDDAGKTYKCENCGSKF